MLTDFYQLTMVYALWKAGRHMEPAVFEMFFRKCPFQGEYAILAGTDEVLRHIAAFRFSPEDLDFFERSCPQLWVPLRVRSIPSTSTSSRARSPGPEASHGQGLQLCVHPGGLCVW
jgi:nicotinic acid phosphoribosyltransferase